MNKENDPNASQQPIIQNPQVVFNLLQQKPNAQTVKSMGNQLFNDLKNF
jgi:hypothetical protein